MAKSIFYEPTVTFSLLNIMKFPKGVAEIMSSREWARPPDNNRTPPPAPLTERRNGRKDGKIEGSKEREKDNDDEIILTRVA